MGKFRIRWQNAILVVIIFALIGVIIYIATSGAWYKSKQEADVLIQLGNPVSIKLSGDNPDGTIETWHDIYNNVEYAGALPGDKVTGTVYIEKDGEISDCVVRARVEVVIYSSSSNSLVGAIEKPLADYTALETNLVNIIAEQLTFNTSDWTTGTDTDSIWVYYNDIFTSTSGNEASGKVEYLPEVVLPKSLTNEYKNIIFGIFVEAEAIQSAHFDDLIINDTSTGWTESDVPTNLFNKIVEYNNNREA